MRALIDMLAAGKLHPRIHARLPLAEAVRAHEMLESGAVLGKLLLSAVSGVSAPRGPFHRAMRGPLLPLCGGPTKKLKPRRVFDLIVPVKTHVFDDAVTHDDDAAFLARPWRSAGAW